MTFDEVYDLTKDFILPYMSPLGKRTKKELFDLAREANKLEGIAAEAGVFGGASLFMLAHAFDGQIQAFDSWSGFPDLTEHDRMDMYKKGSFFAPLELAKERLSFTDRVSWHKGYFEDTLPTIDKSTKYSYVFVDADLYGSVKTCFNFFWPKMIQGGVLIFDDYFCAHTPGVRIFIDELFGDKSNWPSHISNTECLVILKS